MVPALHVEEGVMTPAARISFATPILLVIVRVKHAVLPVIHVEELVMTPAASI